MKNLRPSRLFYTILLVPGQQEETFKYNNELTTILFYYFKDSNHSGFIECFRVLLSSF